MMKERKRGEMSVGRRGVRDIQETCMKDEKERKHNENRILRSYFYIFSSFGSIFKNIFENLKTGNMIDYQTCIVLKNEKRKSKKKQER